MEKKEVSYHTIASYINYDLRHKAFSSRVVHEDKNSVTLCHLVAYFVGRINLINYADEYKKDHEIDPKDKVYKMLVDIDKDVRLGLNKSNRREMIEYLTKIFNSYLEFDEVWHDRNWQGFIDRHFDGYKICGTLPKEVVEKVKNIYDECYKSDKIFVMNKRKKIEESEDACN